ncbi:MAG TPA: MerR family transcriptional regulator [Streptosporangiaceae bacterium]|jgi:DNA-binding transcriptional MerR regulator|nr:MerR family transcriptional regulator [Streptosporangiaceae bacterium]
MDGAWTISELAELAGAALADDPVRVNGRVRELPNERLIRWYTTIGLLDPPLARRGRTALYGPRHLLQLVAVKRRQAAGLAIAQIQAELTGATDDMLRDIARLPETVRPGAPGGDHGSDGYTLAADPVTSARRPRSRERFWAAVPAAGQAAVQAAPTAARDTAPTSTSDTAPATPQTAEPSQTTEPEGAAAPPAAAAVVPGIRLAAGVTLLLDGAARFITAADLVAIEAAARPLIDELRRRGLHPEHTEQAPSTSPGRRST